MAAFVAAVPAAAQDDDSAYVFRRVMDAQSLVRRVTMTVSTRIERTCYSPRQEITSLVDLDLDNDMLRLRMETDDALLGKLVSAIGDEQQQGAGVVSSELTAQDGQVLVGVNDRPFTRLQNDSFCSMCMPFLRNAVGLIKDGGLRSSAAAELLGIQPVEFVDGCMKNQQIAMPSFGAVFGFFLIGLDGQRIAGSGEAFIDGEPVFELLTVCASMPLAQFFQYSFDISNVSAPKAEVKYYISKRTFRLVALHYEASATGFPTGPEQNPCAVLVQGDARFDYPDLTR